MSGTLRLVAVDDEPAILSMIEKILARPGLEIHSVTDSLHAWEIIQREQPDIVIADLVMPQLDGMRLLELVTAFNPAIDLVLMSGQYTTQSAVEAIQKGACDFLTKPIDVEVFHQRIGSLLDAARNRREAARLEGEMLRAANYAGMIGSSPAMLEVFTTIRRVAPHLRGGLITGPSGTEMELVARALHELGPTATGPFLSCNCTAIQEGAFESELFGAPDRPGLLEQASGGTLLLSEVEAVPLSTQSRLFVAVESGTMRAPGSAASVPLNLRLLASSSRDLRAMAREQEFRDDLFFWLSILRIQIPGLVERPEDIPLLTRHFVRLYAQRFDKDINGLTRRASLTLSRYAWPGNVRELEHAIAHACLMTARNVIDVLDLPEYLRAAAAQHTAWGSDLITLEEVERRHARYVVSKLNGNKLRAAEVLGISRNTLYKLLEE
jgi:DNA-binding NtrC family response regulator